MEGHASISPDVIARYAGDAALEVDGVRGLVDRHVPRQRGVRISVGDDQRISVELHLALSWGTTFPEAGRAVQDRVSSYLASMADAQPTRIDVVVAEIGRARA